MGRIPGFVYTAGESPSSRLNALERRRPAPHGRVFVTTQAPTREEGLMDRITSLTIALQPPVPTRCEFPPEVIQQIKTSAMNFGQRLIERAATPMADPASLLNWEQELHALLLRECLEPVTGAMITAAMRDPVIALKANGLLELMPRARLQNSAQRVTIDLLGGGGVTVTTPYYLHRASSRRGHGGRGKVGNGLYPQLSVLGIRSRSGHSASSRGRRMRWPRWSSSTRLAGSVGCDRGSSSTLTSVMSFSPPLDCARVASLPETAATRGCEIPRSSCAR